MSTLRRSMTTMASRIVRRDHLKHQAGIQEEKLRTLQVELGALRGELGKAEADLQKIGAVMARLRRVCEFPDEYGEHWDEASGDRSKLGDIMAQTNGVLQHSWTIEARTESQSTLPSFDSSVSEL